MAGTKSRAHQTELFFSWAHSKGSYIFQAPGIKMSNSGQSNVGRRDVCLFQGWPLNFSCNPPRSPITHQLARCRRRVQEPWGPLSHWMQRAWLPVCLQESHPTGHLWHESERDLRWVETEFWRLFLQWLAYPDDHSHQNCTQGERNNFTKENQEAIYVFKKREMKYWSCLLPYCR